MEPESEKILLAFGGVFFKHISGKELVSDEKIYTKYVGCCKSIAFSKLHQKLYISFLLNPLGLSSNQVVRRTLVQLGL